MDPESAWAVARLNCTEQLLTQFSIIDLATNDDDENKGDNSPSLCIHQIAFWDEMHKEQIVGLVRNCSYHFPSDANGKYVPNG